MPEASFFVVGDLLKDDHHSPSLQFFLLLLIYLLEIGSAHLVGILNILQKPVEIISKSLNKYD